MIKKHEAKAFLQVNLKRIMRQADIGVRALAAASENDPMVVSRIINHGKMPEADKLLRIAMALSITMEDLFKPTAAGKRKLLEIIEK